ncbi:MAG TPA: hypothetical protein VFC96_02200 [Anaerovoracaceae bacterium]|nr:hypothetical protein [Anaerovoracaceae bacterium]
MRLCKSKTKSETGYDYVVNSLDILTPYGQKRVKAIEAFGPGDEEGLREVLNCLEQTITSMKEEPQLFEKIQEILRQIKDNSLTIERSSNDVLTIVELYEIKIFLMQTEKISQHLKLAKSAKIPVPEAFLPIELGSLLDILDPDLERINTFYIYDSFSEKLAALRRKKRQLDLDIRKINKMQKHALEAKYRITMTPKFEYMVSKADKNLIKEANSIPELIISDEDYMTAIYTLRGDEKTDQLRMRLEEVNKDIEDEEFAIRERLSSEIGRHKNQLVQNCDIIGELDFNLAKAKFSIRSNCVKPVIVKDHIIRISNGRQLILEDILKKSGRDYCPVSIELYDGVACITGANMGGKTITLKMVGQCVLLAQHGFFVSCDEAEIGLSGYVHILVGDSQNLQRGLSSFGSEMEELKDILDRSKDRALLLIDEIAGGTNPVEGQALTKAIVSYLSIKPYISLITTHFDNVAVGENIRQMQVRGLKGANFENLTREIKYANKQERIEIIGKYMDYRIYEVSGEDRIPKDALNIAKMLGLNRDIIESAKKNMEDRYEE